MPSTPSSPGRTGNSRHRKSPRHCPGQATSGPCRPTRGVRPQPLKKRHRIPSFLFEYFVNCQCRRLHSSPFVPLSCPIKVTATFRDARFGSGTGNGIRSGSRRGVSICQKFSVDTNQLQCRRIESASIAGHARKRCVLSPARLKVQSILPTIWASLARQVWGS